MAWDDEKTDDEDILYASDYNTIVSQIKGRILHSLATAENDMLVASGAGAFVKKTLAEVKTILGLGSAAYLDVGTASGDVAAGNRGLPSGGTEGQIIKKVDGTNFNVTWGDPIDADALVYKGAINCSTNPNYPAADAGDTYKVSAAGKIGGASGPSVAVGDLIICSVNSTASGDHATVGSHWSVIGATTEGGVAGPTSSIDGNFPAFSGTSGGSIVDSGTGPSSFLQKTLATAANLFLVSSAANTWAVKTIAEIKTLLGLGGAAYLDVGTEAGSVCAGDDARLSDSRTPTSHGNEAHSSTFLTEIDIHGATPETAIADDDEILIYDASASANRRMTRANFLDGISASYTLPTASADTLGGVKIGSGITITDGVISTSGGGGITWNEVTGTAQAAAADNGYICNNAALVTVTLPSTCAVGKTIRIAGKGTGLWKIAQNAGQIIYFGDQNTTSGTAGYLAAQNQYDSIELLCITANTTFNVISVVGNITVI